ncbi:alpha/beta hydrolase [Candidatus Leptofilum sp.]|uniref:alpha/beta hydrolase n=1 Tax=Candidatus Leptofilum sp. TaxID=3241576 RepID=UPI003B5B6091
MTTKVIGPHQGQPILQRGKPIDEAKAAMILVHRRGGSSHSIFQFINLPHPEIAYFAPQAGGHTWYPYSFLAPLSQNEPGISSGLQAIADLITHIEAAGIPAEKIIIGGFSQGACLASEFVARNARRYGGLLVFSGGLIGPPGTPRNYEGALDGTPIFIGCSDVDFHIPVERVEETAVTLTNLGASVNKKIYPSMGHTIIQDELDHAQQIVKNLLATD